MKYIDSISVASFKQEEDYILERKPTKADMQCYSNSIYPFNIFPQKKLRTIRFENITIICGGNGCGKSTLLNIMAEKLGVTRRAPFNYTPYYEDYLKLCSAELTFGMRLPSGSRIITSDDVFDFLLDIRAINTGVDRRREELFDEYRDGNEFSLGYRLSSLDDYDELKRRNDARKMTKSQYVSRSLPKNLTTHSNGESGFSYFTQEIRENALYLLDEPENSLSAVLQKKLADFITDSARFYGCQFIISTHSPFLLAMKDALVYDLDMSPAGVCRWTDVSSVRLWYDFFREHEAEFNY